MSSKKRQCKTCQRYRAPKGRTECSRCRHLRTKREQPMRYLFNMHRSNARRRKPAHFPGGIPWELTYEEFLGLWEQSGKLPEKLAAVSNPNAPACKYEIDRIDPYQGYKPGNVRIVTKHMNILYWYNPRLNQMEFDFTVNIDPDISEDWKQQVPF